MCSVCTTMLENWQNVYALRDADYTRIRDKIRWILRKVRQKINAYLTNYRVAVSLLVGQGCERSELPCLAGGLIKLGRRSWSFYIYRSCCPVDRRI